MKVPKSKQFDLSEALKATGAENRLLTAIRCDSCGAGVISALQCTQAALQAISKVTQLPRAFEWVKVANVLKKKCEMLEAGNGQNDAITELRELPTDQKIPVFSILAQPPATNLYGEQASRSIALLGQIILAAVATNTPINAGAMDGWATLRRSGISRSGRHEHWATVAASVPITTAEIDTALAFAAPNRLRTLLEVAREAIATPLADATALASSVASDTAQPEDSQEKMNGADDRFTPTDIDEVEDPDEPKRGSPEAHEEDSKDGDSHKNSPTGWLIRQANFARYTQQFGLLGDRNKIHPLQVKKTWKEMMVAFRDGDDRLKDQIALAHISYKSSLPGTMALELSIDQTKFPHANLSVGGFFWNYGHALHKQEEGEKENSPKLPRGDIESIFLAFDEEIAEHLRNRHSQTPDAAKIREILRIGSDINAKKRWLKCYRERLRTFGDPAHPNYDARFARSSGDVCNYVLGSEVESIFLAQNYQSCTFGTLHYLTLPSSYLQTCEKKVNDFLGFKTRPKERICDLKGSTIHISKDDFINGWQSMQHDTSVAMDAMKYASTQPELVTAFNNLVVLRLVALITVTGHRGKKISRLTWHALYTHHAMLHVYDKDVGDYQSDRIIPAHKHADQLLAAWQVDLQCLMKKATELGIDIASEGRRGISTDRTEQPAFFLLKTALTPQGTQIHRSPIGGKRLSESANFHFGSPLNIGRHFLVSQLAIRGVNVWLIRVLTGHARTHAEAFSDPMGIPPAIALARLKVAMEDFMSSLNLAEIPCFAALPATRKVLLTKGVVPKIATDQYLFPKVGAGMRVLPPPFDVHTLTSLRVVEELRKKLLKKVRSLSYSSRFVASLTLFNGIDFADQFEIYQNLGTSIVKIGATSWAIWRRPDCSAEICLPLIGPTAIALARLDRKNPGYWATQAREIGAWAKVEFAELNWPTDDFDTFHTLCAMAARHRRYICSPLALTAQSSAIPAATPSRRSLLRLASSEKRIEPDALGHAIRRGKSKTKIQVQGSLALVTEALRKVANTEMRLGEDLARARSLKDLLASIDTDSDLRSKALKDVCNMEATLWEERSPMANDFSTLAGYLNDVLISFDLLSGNDDLSSMSTDEIEEWVDEAMAAMDSVKRNDRKVKLDEIRYFGLKRFLKIGALLGWEIPKGLFQEGPRAMFVGVRKSAASTLLLGSDHATIQAILKSHFDGWPVQASRACLAEKLLWHAPLRSAEQSILHKTSVTHTIDALGVHTDGYSHLKSRHAPRVISIPFELADEVRTIKFDPLEGKDPFLFLRGEGNDWSMAREIDAAIINAATLATGESTVRKHTYRASAIARRAAPEWEQMADALLQNIWTAQQHRNHLEKNCDLGFANFIHATRDAGHGHSLITTVYYFSIWPFVLANQLAASLADHEPDGEYLAEALGNTDRIRTANARAKKSGLPFNVWQGANRIALELAALEPIVPTEPDVIVVPGRSADSRKVADFESCVLFGSSMLLGMDFEESAHAFGIIKPLALRIDRLLPQGRHRTAFQRRKHGFASKHALEIDRRFLHSKDGIGLLTHLQKKGLRPLIEISDDLNPDRRSVASPNLSSDELLERAKQHLNCLPAGLGIKLQFGLAHPSGISNEQLQPVRDRLFIGTPSDRIGAFPRFQVVDAKNPKRETSTGRWSVATRVLATSIVSFLKVSKEYGNES